MVTRTAAGSSRVVPGPPARAGRLLPYVVVALLGLAPLLPLLAMTYLTTVDGPAHVLDAFVLAHYHDAGSAAFRRYYLLTAAPTPNLLTQVLLAAPLRVLHPDATEKLFAVADVALFCVGTTYAVRSFGRDRWLLAALAAPLATGYLFFFGFYNFSLGTGLALLTLGWYLRRRRVWRPGPTLVLALLLLLTASAHLLPFGLTALFVTADALLPVVRARGGEELGDRVRAALPPLLALVVPSALSLVFLLSGAVRSSATPGPSLAASIRDRLRPHRLLRAFAGQVLVYDRGELVAGVLLSAALVGLTVLVLLDRRRGIRGPRESGGPAVVAWGSAALCLALFAVFPDALGTLAYISPRFALFSMLFLVLALASRAWSPRLLQATLALAVAVTLALTFLRIPQERSYNRDLREYASAGKRISRGSTFVALRFSGEPSPGVGQVDYDPTLHQGSRISMATRAVELNHLDGRYEYFPAHFRDVSDLGPRDSDLNHPDEWVALLEQPRDRPQVVLVLGRRRMSPAQLADPLTQRAMNLLDASYVQTWTSRPRGLVELYTRR